eukprot:TRINITY_DN13231_c0_g2_i1.p1 TRINITY_DN13231_c0_g2~~TRINITY_DN13231_c0_g2_i1.p1  ORF type:complete len:310 (-),score=-9.08 TRINITY_DN13231_c0_g2_i1:815-1744(-)
MSPMARLLTFRPISNPVLIPAIKYSSPSRWCCVIRNSFSEHFRCCSSSPLSPSNHCRLPISSSPSNLFDCHAVMSRSYLERASRQIRRSDGSYRRRGPFRPLQFGKYTSDSQWHSMLLLAASLCAVAPKALADEQGHVAGPQCSARQALGDFKVVRMPGDGRCLFLAVVYGCCRKSRGGMPSLRAQTQMADELRSKVADEFVKRREETEWFLEGDFDRYVRNMRRPHAWGGEPEMLMMSHVLRTPITVCMRDPKDNDNLITLAEYGEEYGKDKSIEPIFVLYNGSSHYDALELSKGTDGGLREQIQSRM